MGLLMRRPITSARAVRRIGWCAGALLLGLWAIWWATSLTRNRLSGRNWTWIPAHGHPHLGLDLLYSYKASLAWLGGMDPYLQPYGDPRVFHYPPITLLFFTWCAPFSFRTATILWTGVIALVVAASGRVAWKARNSLGLEGIPWPLALAAILFSSPVIYAMERGNCDAVALAMIVLASGLLAGRPSHRKDALAGVLLAVAFCFKIYPGISLAGLAALRRWRAVGWFVVASAGIWLASPRLTLEFLETTSRYIALLQSNTEQGNQLAAMSRPTGLEPLDPAAHSLSYTWRHLGLPYPLAGLRGELAGLLLVMPLVGYVSLEVYRRTLPGALTFPYLAWMTAMATFLPQVSNDYNLIYLPIVAVAVVSRKDRILVQTMVLVSLFWLQPIGRANWVEIVRFFLAIKYLGIVGVGMALLARVRESGSPRAPDAAAVGTKRSPPTDVDDLRLRPPLPWDGRGPGYSP